MLPKILLMDDEHDTLNMLAMMLRLSGFDVATAETGQKAVALAAEFKPDALILDVNMPDISGIEVLRQIRSQSASQPTAIFLSASIRPGDQEAGLAAGAYAYLIKPVLREKLIATVKEALATRSA